LSYLRSEDDHLLPKVRKGDFIEAVNDENENYEACGNSICVLEGGGIDTYCCGDEIRLLSSDGAKACAEGMA
jgi:hypothetical protein